LMNPVSISRTSPDGRVADSIVAVRVCGADAACACAMPGAGNVESAGRLSAQDCFPQSSWVRWSRTLTNDHGETTSSRVDHRIPEEGTGQIGVNYDETRFGYDVMGRQNTVVNAAGTINRTVFDVRNLGVSTWRGTNDNRATDTDPTGGGAAGNNMMQISASEYDGGSAGGDGNLTQATEYVDGSTTQVTTFEYDFRNRRIVTDGEEDLYEVVEYDNLGQAMRVDRHNTNSGGNLVARNDTAFDDRGRVYQQTRYAVDPSTGTVGNSLIDNLWYDSSGNVICSLPAGSDKFTKSVFDGINRSTDQYYGYNPSAIITPASVEDDVIFDQSEMQYDAASNMIFKIARQRWHNAEGTGPLQGPNDSEPKSRDNYQAMWRDGVGRQVANADYGTNNDMEPPDRPASPPESSDTVLVNRVRYNERSEAFETLDPAGVVNHTVADDAGRTVRSIENYVIGEGCFCPGSEENVTSEMQYRAGQLVALVAKNQATGDQVTRYEYGVTLGESSLASNNLLRAEIFSDADDSSDRVTHAYNRQGQQTRMCDRNGSVHDYEYDLLGRPTGDIVTTLGDGVDGAVRRIGQSYEVRGMVEKATSFSDAAGTTVVNEVQNEFNDFAQISKQYQECNGAVNTGTTPKVQYGYADGSANTIRPTSMTYPNGRILDYQYDDTHADKLSRMRTLHWDNLDVCRYDYIGLNTFVTIDYLEPKVKLDCANGSSPNPYTGFDRFGRIIDLLWEKYGNGSSSSSSSSGEMHDLVHLLYGYDRSSNRTYRRDEVARSDDKTFDELYEYDRLNQLKKFHRGLLVDDNTVIESPGLQQAWQFDATGNWKNFTQFDPTDAAKTLDQQRLHNRVNEITAIARTVGAGWTTPTYERNGNTTGNEDGKQFKYDAWNHLVEVRNVENELLATYRYNALGWRAQEIRGEATTDLYYSAEWQVLEERVDGDVYSQYVWSLVYIDAMILRDRDSDSNGSLDERLYAVHDANFNVLALLDTSGAVVERFAYDAFGVFSVLTPALGARGSSSFAWNYLHQGGRWDADGTVYSFRHREYSPTLGKWLQIDPIGVDASDPNLYRYVENNPIRSVDPTGLYLGFPEPTPKPITPPPLQPIPPQFGGSGGLGNGRSCNPFGPQAPPGSPPIQFLPILPPIQQVPGGHASLPAVPPGRLPPPGIGSTDDSSCKAWAAKEEKRGTKWLELIPHCPCTIPVAPPWKGLIRETWNDPAPASQEFHPGAVWEIRSKPVPNRILVAFVAELALYGFWPVDGLFAEFWRILEQHGATDL